MSIKKSKIIRITTIGFSLNKLLPGQLKFLSQFFDVIAVSSGGRDLEIVREREMIKTCAVPILRQIHLLKDFKSLFLLWRLFLKERPDIVHANTPKASLLSMMAGYFAFVPIRIYTVTGLRFEGFCGTKRHFFKQFEKLTCRFATHVIPEGEGVKRKLMEYSITTKELEVIHFGNVNGVNTDVFSMSHFDLDTCLRNRIEYNIPEHDMVFVFVGRLVKDKGIIELVDAFIKIQKKYSKTTLLLVGPSEDKLDPLPAYIKQTIMKNPKIISVGFQEDVRPFLAIGDVFVLPSYREGFPNVLLQAGAMGLPSVVSNITGCNEIIIHEENGLIVPPSDTYSLYLSMERILKDHRLRASLKDNARERVVRSYESRDVWKKMKIKYESLLDTLP